MSRSLAILTLTVTVIISAVTIQDAEARCHRHRHYRHRCCVNHYTGYSGHGYSSSGCCSNGGYEIANTAYVSRTGQHAYSGTNTSYYRGNPPGQDQGNQQPDLNQNQGRDTGESADAYSSDSGKISGDVSAAAGTDNGDRIDAPDSGTANSATGTNAVTDESVPPSPEATDAAAGAPEQ